MAQRKRPGRPSKLTPEITYRIAELIRAGNYREVAARAAGIGTTTFYRWLDEGARQNRGQFREFWDAIKRAEAEAECKSVAVIDAAAQGGTWHAAAWRLERMFPDRWGRRQRLEEVSEDMLDRDFRRLVRKLEAQGEDVSDLKSEWPGGLGD
jgi:hypothetical protein